ncbi:MAG TPA: hypothetical protein VF286_06685 [Acidiphilium sp.]
MRVLVFSVLSGCLAGTAFAAPAGVHKRDGAAPAVKPPVPLARSGEWATARDSRVSPPDGCFTAGWHPGSASVGLNVDGRKFWLTVGYNSPILEGKTVRTLAVSIDGARRSMHVESKDDYTINVRLTRRETAALVASLEHGAVLTVTSEAIDPVTVSLRGAAPALEAFRACASLPAE